MKNTYYIKTFGCQANTSDSERIAGDYHARGYLPAADWRQASEIVVNTCAVRESAEQRARGFLYNLAQYFQAHPQPHLPSRRPKIILTGCMLHHGQTKLRQFFPIVDEILPINEVGFNSTAIRQDQIHAWVPISVGCNSFCTYCIVPFSRGREQSRPKADILKEVQDLADQGYQEITLLGMNVNSWGLEKIGIGLRKLMLSTQSPFDTTDLPSNQSQYSSPPTPPPFVSLLQAISAIKGIKKIRFLTSNPWDFHPELIAEIAHNQKIDRYIHLPIQSGSNTILKKMNRGYTVETYVNLVNNLRRQIPNVQIGTDIIVGFPTETETDFQATVKLARSLKWQIAFIARYSPRPGTAAYRLYPDDVPAAVKKSRWLILDQIINQSHLHERPHIVS